MLNEGGQKRYVNVKKFLQMTQEYHGFRSMWFALFAAMFYGLIANYHYEFPGDTFTQGSVMDLWTSTEMVVRFGMFNRLKRVDSM